LNAPVPAKLFTVGYATYTTTSLLDRLTSVGVEVLIDVRELPLSRKRGFSKLALAKAAKEHGVEYRHFKSLGVPSHLRRGRKNGELDGVAYMEQFRRILVGNEDVLRDALGVVESRQSCLICLEQHPADCHRSVVADELRKISTNGLEVEHL
jgi:uncharacterized protein (DUF488 family)